VLLVDARDARAGGSDFRPLALSHGSRLILERLGVWERLAPVTPIARIHVSQRGRFGRSILDAAEAGLTALGYVVDYGAALRALDEAVATSGLPILRGARVTSIAHGPRSARVEYDGAQGAGNCAAALVVIADGSADLTGLDVKVADYAQSALVARVEVDLPHGNLAYERFTPEGPLALLPFEHAYALVWTTVPERARALCDAPPADFLVRLQEHFGERAGRFTSVGERSVHALRLHVTEATTFGRAALVGNAAQALHPVAGQGLNLGLRDAWELATAIEQRGVDDEGLLAAYRARRRIDRAGGIAFTHALVKVFSNDNPALAFARGAGLLLIDNLPPVRDFVVRRMVFGARG
jgi:2-octaprenyl-6-methoxyphenol hydroxylase